MWTSPGLARRAEALIGSRPLGKNPVGRNPVWQKPLLGRSQFPSQRLSHLATGIVPEPIHATPCSPLITLPRKTFSNDGVFPIIPFYHTSYNTYANTYALFPGIAASGVAGFLEAHHACMRTSLGLARRAEALIGSRPLGRSPVGRNPVWQKPLLGRSQFPSLHQSRLALGVVSKTNTFAEIPTSLFQGRHFQG